VRAQTPLAKMRHFTCINDTPISKYIEKIGNHATNVAERVIFISTALDIRHTSRMRGSDFS
jgi:phosphate uptake regulator